MRVTIKCVNGHQATACKRGSSIFASCAECGDEAEYRLVGEPATRYDLGIYLCGGGGSECYAEMVKDPDGDYVLAEPTVSKTETVAPQNTTQGEGHRMAGRTDAEYEALLQSRDTWRARAQRMLEEMELDLEEAKE